MDEVLNTDVAGSTAEGLVNSKPIDTTGSAIVLPQGELTPQKVLWHAIQQEDLNRKRNQQAARKALSDLNDIKINGWANHLTELNQQKSDLLDKASAYLQKYRGRSWEEFDPRNAQQAKEALDIQKNLSQLKEMENFSEQVKQWHSQDVNAYKGKEDKIDPESMKANSDFYKKPLADSYQQFSQEGDRPMLQEAYPEWQTKMAQMAKTTAATYVKTVTDKNGMITGYSYKGVPPEASDTNFHAFLISPEGQYGLKDLERQGIKGQAAIDYTKKLWDTHLGTSTTASSVPDQASGAFEKTKGEVGQPVNIDAIVTAPETNKEGEKYVPLEYGGKKVYYSQYAPLTFQNEQALKNLPVNEVYKVESNKKGNYETTSVSADEKAAFHPTGVTIDKNGNAALMMTAPNPKATEPTNKEITSNMSEADKATYLAGQVPDASADDIKKSEDAYENTKQKLIDTGKFTKGSETVQYLAPIDAALESKYNTLVRQKLEDTFPQRKGYASRKNTTTSPVKKTDPLGLF